MEQDLSNSHKFLAIYNEIDDFMRQDLKETRYIGHSDMIYKMIKKGNSVFNYYYEDLKKYARLRNAIVHNPDQRIADPIAEPHDAIVQQYQELLDKVVRPELALDKLAIPIDKLYTITPNTNILKAMKIMNENLYTHLPVMEKRKFIGVFSDSTIFDYIVKYQGAVIDEKLAIRDLGDVIQIQNHASEAFLFVNKDITVIEVEDIFRKGFKDNKKIAVIFITDGGTEAGRILGLITSWKVATYNIT